VVFSEATNNRLAKERGEERLGENHPSILRLFAGSKRKVFIFGFYPSFCCSAGPALCTTSCTILLFSLKDKPQTTTRTTQGTIALLEVAFAAELLPRWMWLSCTSVIDLFSAGNTGCLGVSRPFWSYVELMNPDREETCFGS